MRELGDDQFTRAAGRMWSAGRANPIDWQIRTSLGTFPSTATSRSAHGLERIP